MKLITIFFNLLSYGFSAEMQYLQTLLSANTSFPYISENHIKKKRVYIPESGFIKINKKNSNQSENIYISGPHNPCIFICLENEDEALIFHKYYSNSPEKMLGKINIAFGEVDHSKTKAYIFVTKVFDSDKEEERKMSSNLLYPISLIQRNLDGSGVQQ